MSAGADTDLARSYDMLSHLTPIIMEHQGKDSMTAVPINPDSPPEKVTLGDYSLEISYIGRRGFIAPPKGPARPAQQSAPSASAILISTGSSEFLFAGNGVSIAFTPNTPGPPLAGLGTVEEGSIVNGNWIPGRLLAGGDTAQGQLLQLHRNNILRGTLYRFE